VSVAVQWLVLPLAGAVLATVAVRHGVDRAVTLGIPGARDALVRAAAPQRRAAARVTVVSRNAAAPARG
jgi:hypothetical protein